MKEETVLVVDDSRVSRMMICAIVRENYPGAELVEAANGEEAESKSLGLALDRIILDYNMPGIDGLALAERLLSEHPQAHITLLTANIQSSVQERAKSMGVNFVAKPISEDKICSIFKAG